MDWSTEFHIDSRTEEDLRRVFAGLAASYTPEWRFNPEAPDVGSVLALLFLRQTADNIRRLNRIMHKLHTEFVNLLDVSILPASPAEGIAVVSLTRDTVPGLSLPEATKFLGRTPGGETESVVFETQNNVYITSARITDIVSISGRSGKIIPIRGGPRSAIFLPADQNTLSGPPASEAEPHGGIELFDFSLPGVERFATLLYHPNVFHIEPGAELLFRLAGPDGASPAQVLTNKARYRWSYAIGGSFIPFETVEARGDTVVLRMEGLLEPSAGPCGLVCVEALGGVEDSVAVTDLRIASACRGGPPKFLYHSDQDLDADRFLPFGDTAALFDECYIGHDSIFSQEDAMVSIRFTLSFQERLVALAPQMEIEELKVIKRKPRAIPVETSATAPQEIALDYFNGLGWHKLPCDQDWTTLFDGAHPGDIELTFRCPGDWRPITAGGYEGRCIRLRITRADGCYLVPCIHTMPVVSALCLSYSYDRAWKRPQRLQSVRGTQIEDMTSAMLEGAVVTLFRPLAYAGNALYLGFDQCPQGAPVSLFFDVAESACFQAAPISFEYSSHSGWKTLSVVDDTHGMAAAGTVIFLTPSDMAPIALEGVTRHWLRLVDTGGVYENPARHHPLIRAIYVNAVKICNRETLEEESFYIQAPVPNMTFPIAAKNILSADVYVNEKERLSPAMMRELLTRRPEDVRCTYQFLGGIDEFFVRWTEVECFRDSTPTDRHYVIDRMNSTISFGDGRSVMIPTARNGAAFTVRPVCCKGEGGNLPAGAVDSLRDRHLYIGSVFNPLATCAGSNIESLDSARRRGSSVLNGRGRLVSSLDFTREVRAFSSSICKACCVAAQDLDGRAHPGFVTIAVMMQDYAEGPHSFHSIKPRLKRRLLERCEATLDADSLLLTEPVYASVSLTVWAEPDDIYHTIALQTLIQDAVDGFLDPLGSTEERENWVIGKLPTTAQLGILLRSLRGPGRVSRFQATVWYTDHEGVHECDLDSMPAHPFAIAVPGKHCIYVELASRENEASGGVDKAARSIQAESAILSPCVE